MEERLISNRYRLGLRLGEGGMGVVYKAFDVVEQREVAIKLAGLTAYHEAAARFQREARAMLTLNHPHIVQVYDTGEDGGINYIVMEYLTGKPLRELIPLGVANAVEIAIQIGTALDYAHNRGIIHRDIKPENLMILASSNGKPKPFVKVTDFGLARMVDEQFELSASGMVIGTASYISPEQALGYQIDARTDLYALGVVLYEMLVGRSPFSGDSFIAVIYQHLNEPPPPPRKLNPHVPPSLEQIILRLLRKEPSERFPCAATLVESLRAIQADPTVAASFLVGPAPDLGRATVNAGPPLVGRHAEFSSLRGIVQQARGGIGQLALISGEPGIGKTRLAQETLTYARLCRFQPLTAVCYEQEESFPYQPFIDTIREYTSRATMKDTNQLREALQGYCAEIVALVPEVAKVFGEAPAPIRMMSPDQEKARLFEAVRQFIVGLCQLSPVALFLDDLQWADPTSLQLLHYIIRRTAEQPILILATYRSTEVSQQLSEFLNVLGRDKLQRVVTLGCLTLEQSAAMIKALLGADILSTRLQEIVYAETEGNPFFIVETVQHLAEEGLLMEKGGEWDILPSAEPRISDSVREVIERRLARLPGKVRAVLTVAAVVGRECPFSLLKDASGRAVDDLFHALDDALASGLMRERPHRVEEQYGFTHGLIREVIYLGLTSARRRSLHQRIGEILEQRSANSEEQAFGELAYHFSRGYDAPRAIKYNYMAGRQAAAVYATEDAFRYYDAARGLAEEEGTREYLVDSLEGLGQMAIILGRLERAVESFGQAIGYLEAQEPTPISRLVKLRGEISTAYERLGRYDEALRELEQGLAVAGDVETVESAYLRGQIAVIYSRRGDLIKAMEYATQDLTIAERLGNEEEIAQSCSILHNLHSLRSDWENARRFTERALAIWKKRGDVYRQEWNYLNMGSILWSAGRWEEAEVNWQTALDISQSIRYSQGAVQNSLNLGFLSLLRGDHGRAEGLFGEALALAEEIGHPFYIARCTMRLGQLSRQSGDITRALQLFGEAEAILREIGHKTGLCELLWTMADACVEQEQPGRAQELAQEALDLAPQPGGYEGIGNASRVLAKVYAMWGDFRQARHLLDRSIECLDRLGDAYQQAQARTDLAAFLIARGSSLDRTAALGLLGESLSDFRKLGALPDAKKAEAMLHTREALAMEPPKM